MWLNEANQLINDDQNVNEGNFDASTWKMISNLLDIDFICGDIQGRSCKHIYIPASNSTWTVLTHWPLEEMTVMLIW